MLTLRTPMREADSSSQLGHYAPSYPTSPSGTESLNVHRFERRLIPIVWGGTELCRPTDLTFGLQRESLSRSTVGGLWGRYSPATERYGTQACLCFFS